MIWYIVMALIGGWLVGWTTRGIIERHLNFKVCTPSASHNTQKITWQMFWKWYRTTL